MASSLSSCAFDRGGGGGDTASRLSRDHLPLPPPPAAVAEARLHHASGFGVCLRRSRGRRRPSHHRPPTAAPGRLFLRSFSAPTGSLRQLVAAVATQKSTPLQFDPNPQFSHLGWGQRRKLVPASSSRPLFSSSSSLPPSPGISSLASLSPCLQLLDSSPAAAGRRRLASLVLSPRSPAAMFFKSSLLALLAVQVFGVAAQVRALPRR